MRSVASPALPSPSRTREAHPVSFAREGLPLIAIAALVTAATYALALNRRSWPLWLIAFGLTIASLWIAYFFSDPRQSAPRRARGVASPGAASARVTLVSGDPVRSGRQPTITFIMNDSTVPVDRFRMSLR